MTEQTLMPWGAKEPPPREEILVIKDGVDLKNKTVTFFIPSQQLTIKLKLLSDGRVIDVSRVIEESRMYDASALYIHDATTFGQMTAMLYAILKPAQNQKRKQLQPRLL